MIANLNIMAKTFAKIAKTFVGLLVTIVAIKRRLIDDVSSSSGARR